MSGEEFRDRVLAVAFAFVLVCFGLCLVAGAYRVAFHPDGYKAVVPEQEGGR